MDDMICHLGFHDFFAFYFAFYFACSCFNGMAQI
jgi:hypothetical protein